MKRFTYLLPLIVIFSCKKENEDTHVGEFPVIVKEYKLNQPLPKMTISNYCCIWPDKQYGCLAMGTCGSVSTNVEGKTYLSKAFMQKAAYGFSISGTGYWLQRFSYPDSTMYLDRIGEVNVTLNLIQTYPPNARFDLSFISERGNIAYAVDGAYMPKLELIQTLKAFAGQINSIKWRVYSDMTDIANGTISDLDVPLTGNTSVTINL